MQNHTELGIEIREISSDQRDLSRFKVPLIMGDISISWCWSEPPRKNNGHDFEK